MTDDQLDVRVRDNREAGRYEAMVGGELAGVAEYHLDGARVVFTHTEIEPQFEGKGIGGRLAGAALDDVRGRGLAVTPLCPFIASYIDRHPAYADLVGGQGAATP